MRVMLGACQAGIRVAKLSIFRQVHNLIRFGSPSDKLHHAEKYPVKSYNPVRPF